MPNVLENLHRNLTADGYQLGSLDDFKKAMADSTKAANLYRNLSSDGYQLGSQEEFFKNVGNTSMQKPAQPAQQKPTSVQTVAQSRSQQPKPQPLQLPQGFGQFDLKQAQRMQAGMGYNPWKDPNPDEVVSAHSGNGKPKPKETVNTQLDKDLKSGKQTASMKQVQDQLEYQQMTGKQLGDDRVKNIAWEAPTLARNENGEMQYDQNGSPLVGFTTEQERVARYQQDLKDRERNAIVKSAVDKLQKKMEADALAKYGETQKDNGLAPEFAAGDAFGGYIQYLKDSSPEELLKRLDQAYGYEDAEDRDAKDEELRNQGKSTVLAHWDDNNKQMDFANRFLEDNREAIEQTAERVGMSVDDFVFDELVPQLAGDIAQRYQSNMSEKYSVKDTADYLARMMGNSMIGTLATMGATTKKTRQFLQEELQKSREGKGAHYNSNMATNLLGETMMFAADAAPLMVGGALGGLTSKAVGAGLKQLGWSELGALVSSSSPFLAANVGRAMKYGGLALGSMARGIGSMAPFMAASGVVQDLSTGDGTLASIGRAALDGAWEGTKFGAVTGAFGVGNSAMRSGMSRGWKMAQAPAAFLLENQIFAGLDYIKDPENFNWAESTEDAFYMQLASKFSSAHGIKGVLNEFKEIFSPASKKGVRLSNTDKESIQRAFGGMDFVDIASDVNNIGKILSDKQNIPWTTRMKVAAQTMNTCESSRPRTARIKINGYDKTISEIAQNGDLIEVHKYDNADDLLQTRVAIEDRRKNDDMLADFAKLDMQEKAKPILEGFAQEFGMTNEELWKIMQKKPIERVGDEQDLMDELAKRLHAEAYPKGEKHTEQSAIDGADLAGDSAEMNPDTAAAIGQEVAEAKEAYENFPLSEDLRTAVYGLGDARLDDIYMYVRNNFSGPEVDDYLKVIADYANAQAKQQGYIEKTGLNIDEQVAQDVDEKSFHGTIDSVPDDGNIITIIKDGEEFVLLNGNIGTRDGVAVDPDKSGGMIIARTKDGRWASMAPDALMTISSKEPKEAYADRVREQLQISDTQTAIETGLVQPETKQEIQTPGPKTASKDLPEGVNEGKPIGVELDNAGGEAVVNNDNGANNPPATALSKIPTLKDEQGADILDEEGDPQYQWDKAPLNDTLTALVEINGGNRETVTTTVDAMLSQAQKELESAEKLTPKGKDPIKIARSAAEIKAQQEEARRKLEYWTAAKQELEKANKPETNLNVGPVENNESEKVVDLQPQAASGQQEAEKKPSLKSRLQQLAERYKKKFGAFFDDNIDSPADATELVALNMGTGRQFRWEDKPDGTRGFKTALGIETEFGGRRGSEGHAFAHLFKGKDDTTGMGFDEFVDKVWRSDENTIQGPDGQDYKRFDERQIGDSIIDLFMSAESGKDITEYIIRNRVEKAKKSWEAEQQRLKELAEQNEKIELTDEEAAKIEAELPFVQSTDEEIPDSPITKLDKEAKALMQEAGTPEIKVVDTDRVSDETWRKFAEKAYEGAFIGDEEVEQVKRDLSEGYVIYDEGKIIVFSGKLTPEELREDVEFIKKKIEDDRVRKQERTEEENLVNEGDSSDVEREEAGEGGPETGENRPGKGSPEPNEGTVDDYLKPRNEKEEKIVSDIELKLAEEIKAAEDEVRKAKSELEKARTKESDKATDMFANDKAFETEDQIFSSEEMGLDTTAEGVEKRTKSERDALAAAEQELGRLKSQAEHDSRVRGALDNERRQTSFEEIDERHKREYDEYIKPLLGRSDEELQQLKKAKEDAVGGDMKKLEGDPEYSAINLVLLQRKLDREHEDVKVFIQNTIDDGDVSFVDKATVKEFDELNHLINEYGVDDSEGKIEAYVKRLRKKYPKSDAANPDPIEVIEETATEFREERKEEQKQLGITTDETPQQIADRERAEKLADTPLTDEEVESSSASDVQKTLAKAYLNGNHGILQEAAYLNVYNDVRNRRQDNEANRSDANGAQLASPNDTQERGLRQPGEQTGELVARGDVSAQDEGRIESGGISGVEDSKVDLSTSAGERGNSGVPESKPEVDGLPTGNEQPVGGSGVGSNGRDVRSPRADQRGVRVAGQTEQRENKARQDNSPKPAAGSDAAIAASKQRLAELRKKFRDAGRNGNLSVSLVGMNSEQIGVLGEIITESANLGYQYIHRGMRDFNEWRKQMLADFKDWLQEDFKWTDADVEEYLREVWNCEYNIDGVTRTIGEWASFMGENELKKVVKVDRGSKFEQQKAAENVETKVGDIGNIRESLPFLLPEQQDDVYKAETQFFDEAHQDREHGYGKGMMFTNGTGTGKTYTGLGIVKRFVKQGKGRVLILTPSQEKVTDWRNDGLNLGLDIESLDEEAKAKGTSATKAKGKGVVVTTYANARQNLALLEDCFDLIVYDESHKIMESKDATNTTMMDFHEMLTNKNVERSIDRQTYWLPEWIEHRNLVKEADVNRERLDELSDYEDNQKVKVEGKDVEVGELKAKLNARMVEITNRLEELRPIMQEIRESKRPQADIDSKRTKTVFLSATPFNVRESLRYAEGYLFSFPEEDKNTIGSYNHRSPEDAFLEQMFPAGYRWRYGRLESHVSNAEALGRQEIDFSDYLQNTLQTMSGRMIASDYDYSRDFPVMTLDHAGRFNQAMSEVYRNKRYNALAEAFRKSFDYNYSTALFEAMKTSLVNDRIKEHLARGQKVVVFHRRRTSGDLEPPFRRALDLAELMASQEQDGNRKSEIKSAIAAFEHDFADMLKWEQTIDYSLPREQIEKRFGKDKVAFFSGAETKKTKHQSVEDFMKDNGGKDIIVIQEASGKEGISLHDKTGEHQRVEINLALPQSPIAFIQIEGRIYRIGQKSNAIFEYPLLGLDLETSLFAQRFNNALGTTENLALGSKARNLRKSIANSVLENTGEVDYERQGYGGKDMDGRVDESGDKDGFDMSIQDYYGNQKMSRGRDNREGVDYFPTPEPIGYKMVEWGQMMDGETALEPSAGHGAIARYVPETNAMTAIEPSASLFTKLQMRAGGPGRRFEEMTFEDYPLANKHDAILMNPPYGVGGKTAMEHVAKAFRHLNEGGRIVAIIPDGPAMEKRLDAWLNSKTYGGAQGVDGAAVVVGEVKLPDVAFGRAGTNVRTRIVVIDKVTRAEMRKNMPQKVTVDLSGEESIGGLFDRIRNVRMPERTIDQAAINEKRAKRTEKQLNDNPFVTGVFMGDMGRNGKFMSISTKAGGTTLDIRLSLERLNELDILDKYASLKKYRDNPEELDYGKWSNRSFGAGKNKVPALDAIRDYCETAIKTLENVSKMTADQMDKRLKEIQAEAERRRAEREVERQRAIDERKQKQEAKIKEVTDVALAENKDNEVLSPDGIRLNMKIAHGNLYVMAERAKRALTNAGIDWQTGHKIDKNEPVNARTSTVIDERKERWQGDANKPRKQDYEYALDKNTRTGDDMHLVKFNGARLSSEDYKAVERKAKAQNGYYNRFKKAWHFPTEEDARKFVESMNTPSDMSEGPVRFSEVKDKETIEKLEKSPKIKVYRAMQMIAGKLYPPMAAKRDGKLVDPIELGKWEKADEHPELADENGRFKLDKGNGKSLKAAYNPYIHTSTTMLNDQFSEAQNRDNLVVVECEVPESELTSGYKAEKAKDSVGKMDWKAGIIQGQLSGTREVILSRWDKPVRIVPTEEVAQHISDMIKGKVEVMPTNVVTPQQRAELEKLGVEFVETDNQGRIMYGDNEGETYSSVYGKKKSTVRFSEKKDEEPLHRQHESNVLKRAEKLSKKLGVPVKVATSVDEVTNREASEAIRAGRKIQGWYDTETGEITLYLPNIENSYEGEKVVAHETIGHKGLRALLGENGYKSYCKSLLYDLKNPDLEKYWMENLAKNGFDTYRTIDEFLAEAAEKGYGDLPMWQKVKESMTDALRRAGFTMSPSISDVKYMVWLSKHNLEKGNIMNQVEREALLYKLGKERYEAKVRNGEYGYDLSSEGESSAPYFPGSGETLFRHTPSVKNQRRNYERSLKRIGYVWKEAHIDAMQSAVELMRSISGVKKIEDIPSAENFVLLENQMSSKEEQMDFLFNRDYMEPLDEAVSKCLPDMGKDIDQQLRNLQLYMIKKHGLERNRVLFIRDALRDIRITDKAKADQLEQDYNDFIRDERDELRNGNIDLREYHQDVDDWIKKNIDPSYTPGEKDYSGLTSLYGKGYNEMDVIDEVMGTESMLGDERVKDLWDKTNAVSQFGLDMEYEGGLDSKEKHDKVSDMFEWYVPLRGYDEKTAEEVYDYLEEGGSSRKWAGPVLMNAKGHEHLSDVDVFATLGAMSSSAINRSLRNQMKQAFARFVRDHYNDVDADSRLVTELPYLWAEKQYDPVTGQDVWVENFPDIPEGAKADDIAAILDQYQQDMQAKESNGDAKRVRQNSNIPFRPAKPENKAQHIVDVWINGEKHSFVVNGNPRAAQAINGQLKAERNSNILWLSSLSHFMAKMNTSYSPDFIMRNTERDLIYSAANIAVKENAEYWFKWAKNYGVATGRVAAGVPGLHTNLFKRYRDGNLDMSNPTDRYFKEFMENGGETGWVERKNLDKWKETIKKGVKKDSKLEQVGKAVINALPDVIEAMNERAENMARFATYMTSRQMGRTITRSVSDAKEVSVNFNRKGAGKKTVGLNKGDNSWLSNANAYMAGWSAQNLQDYIMFYNAGVQGMTNMIKNVVNHPIKGSTAFAAFALAGLLMPKINQFLFEEDDDKKGKIPENPYAELPEYVRRNNLCIYADNGNFITIALPIELRAMYGIGDMAASYISNPELRSTKNMGEDIVTQLSQIAPLDFFGEGAGPLWAIVPSGVRPFAEAASNKNWLGQPIERDEERWNKNKPRWTRAFKNVGDAYVGASKKLNAATNPYDYENIKGWADGALTDPALVEHVVNGYFGGVGSSVNRLSQLVKHADEMSPTEAITSNWMPIVRTQLYSPNERTRYARTRSKWWYYKEEADKTQEVIKALKKRGEHNPLDYMQSISEEEGKKGARAKIMDKAYKRYSKVKKKMESTDDLQQMNIYQLQMDQIMEGAVKELDKIN